MSPYLVNTNKLDGLPIQKHATYNCPCEKTECPNLSHKHTSVRFETIIFYYIYKYSLLTIIANANLIGNSNQCFIAYGVTAFIVRSLHRIRCRYMISHYIFVIILQHIFLGWKTCCHHYTE